MSFIDFPTQDAIEPQTAPDNSEQELMIVASKRGVGKNSGKEYIQLTLTIPRIRNFKDFSHFINLPDKNDPATYDKKLWRLKEILDALGISGSFEVPDAEGVGQDDLAGKTFLAFVRLDDDPEYGFQNRVGKLLKPGK